MYQSARFARNAQNVSKCTGSAVGLALWQCAVGLALQQCGRACPTVDAITAQLEPA